MRKLLSSLLVLLATISFTFSSFAVQIDEKINEILNPVSAIVVSIVFFSVEIFEGIKVPLIVVWLIVAAVFCTIYFGFVNIRHFGTAIKIFRSNEKNAPGEVTHKQALWTACAATVGLGNIAGVAIAVSFGVTGYQLATAERSVTPSCSKWAAPGSSRALQFMSDCLDEMADAGML